MNLSTSQHPSHHQEFDMSNLGLWRGGGNFIWHEKYVHLVFAFIVHIILCIYAFDSKLYDPDVQVLAVEPYGHFI